MPMSSTPECPECGSDNVREVVTIGPDPLFWACNECELGFVPAWAGLKAKEAAWHVRRHNEEREIRRGLRRW